MLAHSQNVDMSTLIDCPWNTVGPQGAGLALGDYPAAILMRVATVVQQEITTSYAKAHGLTVPEWRILARLTESAPMQFSQLCAMSFFDKAYAGRVLRGLQERGLATCSTDEAHKRRVVVDITAEGRALTRAIFPVARRHQMKLLSALDADERGALYGALHKLLAAVDRQAPADDDTDGPPARDTTV